MCSRTPEGGASYSDTTTRDWEFEAFCRVLSFISARSHVICDDRTSQTERRRRNVGNVTARQNIAGKLYFYSLAGTGSGVTLSLSRRGLLTAVS